MRSEHFADFENFDELEVAASGADYTEVKYGTIECAQGTCTLLQRKVYIIHNGLTTGTHRSKEHPNGDAIDFTVEGNPNPRCVVTAMLASGFRGIGVYLNNKGYYSYHGDTRQVFADWLVIEGEELPTTIFNPKMLRD